MSTFMLSLLCGAVAGFCWSLAALYAAKKGWYVKRWHVAISYI